LRVCYFCNLHLIIQERSLTITYAYSDCFTKFISAKCVKQIGILGKEIKTPFGGTQRKYILGLSLGPSSTVLLHELNENVEYQLDKGRPAPFELTVVYVDPSSSSPSTSEDAKAAADALERCRARYPRFSFKRVPLSAALGLRTIDWSALPLTLDGNEERTADERLNDLFASLPSVTSRADILRLLTRHLLINEARQNSCHAVLLGHSTTALAELTLAETAKGRGFSLPWQINDGSLNVVDFDGEEVEEASSSPVAPGTQTVEQPTNNNTEKTPTSPETIRIYHPLRDLLRRELITYTTLTVPPLTDLLPPASASELATAAVVSHRDLSIEEVMVRYFAEVEKEYPSVVANVARTTGKLIRLFGDSQQQHQETTCGVCSMPLDEQGDERWRGELGDQDYNHEGERVGEGKQARLCYGCERSIRG